MSARVATLADLDVLTETIQLAFADDPVWSRAFAHHDDRVNHLAVFWRLWLEGALRFPWVWMTEAGEAVSVWIPPGEDELSPEQDAAFERIAESSLGRRGAAYLDAVMARFAEAHPHGEPHYYLSLLGTHPAHRGLGLGISLLTENLTRIDAEGTAAYLESSNPANDQRYERLGFAFHGRFKLPDDGPIVTTMWRPGRKGLEPSQLRRP
jgi:GNAT superfamily N-acetyltransferase